MEIKLPQLSWFRQIQDNRPVRNFFSGSLGTDPERGSLRHKTFNYEVYAEELKKDDGEELIILIAKCHILHPWSQGFERTDHQQKEFKFSAEGIEQAAAWIEEQYKVLMPQEQ